MNDNVKYCDFFKVLDLCILRKYAKPCQLNIFRKIINVLRDNSVSLTFILKMKHMVFLRSRKIQ